ncbi:hypothetical protein N0V82_002798 [Gnomoniopsis sp. IMI 355080]|nr:hypothetical protein N0V82_002798 [Gnomoniopsis sp. IMI 355080]
MYKLFRDAKTSAADAELGGYGLHVLVDKDPDAENVVDIVAVHGLNGHYENTWTSIHKDGTPSNWLKIMLPKIAQQEHVNTRVMSFSYNSSVQFSKSTSDVFVFADQLLEHLLAKRTQEGEQKRPIIFICHSLGGIVVKQASLRITSPPSLQLFLILPLDQLLNRANESPENREAIHYHVSAICFFGTPHRGSELAPWASTISKILKAGAVGSHTNSQLAKDLERKSHVLKQVSKSFLQHGGRLKIVSFTETEKLDWLNCLVVDQDSAILAWPNELVVPIDGDHRTICRFSSLRDPRFAPVAARLRQVFGNIKRQPAVFLQNQMQDFDARQIMSLLQSNYKSHKARNPDAVSGTCSWILRHTQFQAWQQTSRRSLLWISADAGCGKSVMASFLVDHLKNNNENDNNICYFFFKDDSMEQNDAVISISAFLHQLYSAHPELISFAQETLRVPGNTLARLDSLWTIFARSVAQIPSESTTICILDGLDECEESSRKQLMQLLAGYFKTPIANPEEPETSCMKMLVLSRPDNSIKVMLDRQTPNTRDGTSPFVLPTWNMIRLRGEDETDAISKDTRLVIQAAIRDLADIGIPHDFLLEMEKQLVLRADRTFLWTTLIIQLLKEKAVEGASRREMIGILQSRSVYSIYTVLLDSKTHKTASIKRKARKMLGFLLAAMRPLTVDEMNIALAIKPDHDTFAIAKSRPRPSRRTFQNVENELRTISNHFAGTSSVLYKGRVYLVHQTAREFLLDEASTRELVEFYPDAPDESSDDGLWELSDSETEHSQVSTKSSALRVKNTESVPIPTDCEADPEWQHSFSLDSCHASLLEICATYLYMLGKPCEKAQHELGQPTEKLANFLTYAAEYWVTHFHNVCTRIAPADLPYYHGLCHPLFPGLTTWLEAYDGHGRAAVLLSGPVDEQQDMIIEKFALEPGHYKFGKDFTTKVDVRQIGGGNENYLQYLSCNPSQALSLNFPVRVDSTGLVSLDFERFKAERERFLSSDT